MSDPSAATLEGRALAEAVMQDACTITRTAGPGTLNDTTLRYDPPVQTEVYAGRCRVTNQPYASPTESDAGDRRVFQLATAISVPIGAEVIHVGDVVTVTESLLDPSLVGRVFTVRGIAHKTYLTARRLSCEEMTR